MNIGILPVLVDPIKQIVLRANELAQGFQAEADHVSWHGQSFLVSFYVEDCAV